MTNVKYEFRVNHRKDTIANIHIKPTSFIWPNTTKGIFKGFLYRTHTICSEKYIKQEVQFLIDMLVGNELSK